jgi:hypothetical protein
MSTAPLLTNQREVEYATADDTQKLFVAAMNDLFCLAFFLTASADRAEDCIIRSIRECMKNTCMLKENLLAWVRNSIIRNGIAIVTEFELDSTHDAQIDSLPLIPESSQVCVGTTDCSAGILELSGFDRLVYVICIIADYTSRHCALLLSRSREEVREARNRALAHIAEFESKWRDLPIDSSSDSKSPPCGCRTEFECSCGSLLD